MSKEEEVPKKRDASDVYDRQIRLWGKEAQEKMAKAKVLYIHMTGVSSEILKNLVLAGIRATICDSRSFPSAVVDTPSFLLPPSATTTEEPSPNKKTKYETVGQAMKPVVEDLNHLLGECPIIDKDVTELDSNILQEYPIVIASRIRPSEAKRLSEIVTSAGNAFFMADCFGLCGGSVMDLGPNFTYRPEVGKKLLDPKPLEPRITTKEILETPLQDAVNRFHKQHPPPVYMRYRAILEYRDSNKGKGVDDENDFVSKTREFIQSTSPKLIDHELYQEESLKGLAKVANAEITPVCAVLGGMLGNEVIKAVSGKGQPANNTVLFDGESCKAWTFLVKPNKA